MRMPFAVLWPDLPVQMIYEAASHTWCRQQTETPQCNRKADILQIFLDGFCLKHLVVVLWDHDILLLRPEARWTFQNVYYGKAID